MEKQNQDKRVRYGMGSPLCEDYRGRGRGAA